MNPIRVVHVITRLELGGAQENTLYTVSHLDRTRFEPHLISGQGGMLDEEARGLSVVTTTFCKHLVRELNPLKDFLAYRELVSHFRRLKPNIVHTHSSKAGILGRFAASAAGVPVIIHTYHGFGFHRYQNPAPFLFYVKVEKAACKRTNHLVFVSEENRKWADELGLTGKCSTSLIRSGIAVQQIQSTPRSEELRREIEAPPGSKLVGMIACLKPQKDPVTFVRAAGLVLQQAPDTHFLVVGDGELRTLVMKEAALLPAGRFHFLGWRRDVFQILRELDLLVLTSLWEGLPRVIPEAIVAGVPVVASNIDGNREILLNVDAGLLAEPRNPHDFALKIGKALRENLGVDDETRARIGGEFDINAMIDAQEKLYSRLIEKC